MPENSAKKPVPDTVEHVEPATTGLGFPKSMHLRKRGDFDRVFAHKRSQADGVLIVYGMANGLNVSRLGLVVSKKVGKAHQRNRWKRLIREVFRLEQHAMTASLDLVVIPRQGVEPEFDAVRRSLCKLVKRLRAGV